MITLKVRGRGVASGSFIIPFKLYIADRVDHVYASLPQLIKGTLLFNFINCEHYFYWTAGNYFAYGDIE